MASFLLRRLLLAIPTLAGVLVVVFALLYVAPGDPVMEMVGERADAATIARLRKELRLDEPVSKQFLHYAGGVLRGDLGHSYITGRPIAQDIRQRFPKTLELAVAAMLLAGVVGITIGVFSAARPGSWFDRLALGASYLGISFPVYWVGLILILVFAVMLRWLPPSGYGRFAYLVLPALALGTRSIAFLARMTRSSMLEVLSGDYIRTARAKGLRDAMVLGRHALRNALIPVITVFGLDFGYYLTGSILTETVFSWPGLGRYVVNAISRRDLPAIQGTVLFLSVVFVLVNLVTDVVYAAVDPRVGFD
ncbi:MAG TPA: ABC transporter permease [Gemmatimonadaceae bacterium]|jgi:peptide/nickel transport system permease protein/oligopeptide transport system permease protein|nr:ABC transporter permease [Gemmatimonadaceae bacterium]